MEIEKTGLIPSSNNLPEKPQESIQHELKIRNSLIEQGVEREIADAVVGYRPEQVPFVYQSEPHEVLHHRVRDNWTEGYELLPGESALWLGATDAIHNLVDENGWNDQIPEVIAQWRGSAIPASEQTTAHTEITRTEIKQLGDGRFVEVEYTNVSGMGAFDGQISQISLNVPESKFVPGGYSKARQSYRIYYFRHNRKANLDGVPGGFLARKDEEQHEWTLDTTRGSNVSGTTILNGYQEMLNFHMPDLSPIKEDYSKVRRFRPLPEPKPAALLPASPEAQFDLVMAQETGLSTEKVLEVAEVARKLNELIAPQVVTKLAQGEDTHGTIQMEVDGILNHADKIWLFNKTLEGFSREQRFTLARNVAKLVKDGHFTAWMQSLQKPENAKFVGDAINANTRYLLTWFKEKASADTDLIGWMEKAGRAAEIAAQGADVKSRTAHVKVDGAPASISGANPFHSHEYSQVFNGMVTTFVERFIEYIGQQYLGNTLE